MSSVRSSLLWGVVGALAFLVLAQGYVIAVGRLPLGFFGRIGVALVIGVVVAVVSHATPTTKGRT